MRCRHQGWMMAFGVSTDLAKLAGLMCLLVFMLIFAGSANAAATRSDPKKAKNPVDRILAIYVPENQSDSRLYIPQLGTSFTPGKALEDAAVAAGPFSV